MATAPPTPDAVLVRRLRERDRTAWEEVYAAYGSRLRQFAFRLAGDPHDADDLVQETFVRVLPRLDRLDPGTVELGPYLFTALRNTFLKQVERSKRVVPTDEVPEPDVPVAIEDDPVRGTMLAAQQEEVRIANANLAPRQRLVLALRELEDRSYAEIGEVVGLNENAVAQLISRARESLRTELRLAQVDPERLPEECRTFLPLLSRHLDGALRGPQLEKTLAHLEGCERCQDALASMREASRRYRSLFPLLAGAEEARAAEIDAALDAAGYWRPPRRLLASGSRRLAVLAVAGIAVLALSGVGAGVMATRESRPPAAAPPETTRETTVAPPTAAPPTSTAPPPPTTRPVTTPAPKPKPVTTSPATTTAPEKAPETTTTTATTPPATTAPATTTPEPTTTTPATTGPATTAPATTAAATTAPASTTTSTPPAPFDRTAPTVSFTARPPATIAERSVSLSFRASESKATFSCRLDGAAFAPCTSPRRLDGLAAGSHAFEVRARDAAGNVGPPASARWEVVIPDTTPPAVMISSATTAGTEATFAFAASEPGVAFTCVLDGGAPEPCASPKGYAALAPGAHAFAVRGTDASGNTGAPVEHAWTVAPPPPPQPNLVISSIGPTGFTVTNAGTAAAGAFIVTATFHGTYTFGGLGPGQSQARTWSACRVGTIVAVADRDNRIAESDETDNTRSFTSSC